jgi:hypothetical protein
MALINGRQYEFADLTLYLAGRDVTGFRGIKYASKYDKEVLYGKGNKPMSVQRGNYSYEGELSLTQSELETLKALGGGSILELSLNAVVCYGNPAKGDTLITDKLSGIQFTEDAKEIKQGDKFMEITLPFLCLDIQYQTA